MVVGRDVGRSWSRVDRLVLGTLVVIVLLSAVFLIHPWYQPRPDAAIYISTARSIAAGQGITYLASPSVLRPPGLPILISPLVAGEGAPDFTLLTVDGEEFTLSEAYANRPVVIEFGSFT